MKSVLRVEPFLGWNCREQTKANTQNLRKKLSQIANFFWNLAKYTFEFTKIIVNYTEKNIHGQEMKPIYEKAIYYI